MASARAFVDVCGGYGFQHGDTCCGGYGLGVVGAGLGHPMNAVPFGVVSESHQLHDLGLAAHRRAGLASRHDLGHGGQIGPEVPAYLRPAARQAKAGDDLVHDEDHAVPIGDVSKVL